MLISGQRKLERMRDGRIVYIGAERVDDVTSHPAFREGAKTIAGLYDLKADPAKRDLFSFEEDGERISLYWLRCRNRDDLARRMRCCKAIADATYGFVGRSPDQVSGLVTGLAMNASLLDGLRPGFGQNLLKYYDFARKNDLYLSFAVTPASGSVSIGCAAATATISRDECAAARPLPRRPMALSGARLIRCPVS